jgi:glutathionylspermidine synthase
VSRPGPLCAGPALEARAFDELRRRMIFDWGKWDPQVEDQCALAPFPLVLSGAAWGQISRAAVSLYEESLAAERELMARTELHEYLGLPWRLRGALGDACRDPARSGVRVIRFDFHLTTEGWQISEANTDVPGGFLEAAGLGDCFAQLGSAGGLTPTGDPGRAVADGMATRLGGRGNVALVHASAYTDDRQVMHRLARVIGEVGLKGHVLAPDQLRWEGGACAAAGQTMDAIFRFFPAEWLVSLPRACDWWKFFFNTDVPHTNPPAAILTQSKRFPLVWDRLDTKLPTWRRLLPRTRDPRVRLDRNCVLKPALGRVGEMVLIEGVSSAKEARRIRWWPRLFPSAWAAQRRFEAEAIDSPLGPVYPAIGVFVVDGRVAGVYGRVATRPLVDKLARDCAVFVAPEPAVVDVKPGGVHEPAGTV